MRKVNKQTKTTPYKNKCVIRKFLNKDNTKPAAIVCDFDANYFHPSVKVGKNKRERDKTKLVCNTTGQIIITDCRRQITLDLYDTDKNNINKLNLIINALTQCRNFIESNPTTSKIGDF